MKIVNVRTIHGLELVAQLSNHYDVRDNKVILALSQTDADEFTLDRPLAVKSDMILQPAPGGKVAQTMTAHLYPLLSISDRVESITLQAKDVLIIREVTKHGEQFYMQMTSGLQVASGVVGNEKHGGSGLLR